MDYHDSSVKSICSYWHFYVCEEKSTDKLSTHKCALQKPCWSWLWLLSSSNFMTSWLMTLKGQNQEHPQQETQSHAMEEDTNVLSHTQVPFDFFYCALISFRCLGFQQLNTIRTIRNTCHVCQHNRRKFSVLIFVILFVASGGESPPLSFAVKQFRTCLF